MNLGLLITILACVLLKPTIACTCTGNTYECHGEAVAKHSIKAPNCPNVKAVILVTNSPAICTLCKHLHVYGEAKITVRTSKCSCLQDCCHQIFGCSCSKETALKSAKEAQPSVHPAVSSPTEPAIGLALANESKPYVSLSISLVVPTSLVLLLAALVCHYKTKLQQDLDETRRMVHEMSAMDMHPFPPPIANSTEDISPILPVESQA